MKKTLLLSTLSLVLFSGVVNAQETERKIEKQEVKNVSKEVRMEDKNGEKVMTIVTNENGKKSEEIYKGEAAEKKMAELQAVKSDASEAKKTVEVKMEEVDGVKHLKIKTIENGKTTFESYKGEEAELKLKELESGELVDKRAKKKVIIKEEKVLKKSDF